MENEGYDVKKAYSAAEAIYFVENCAPSLAILDVMLPDMDGFMLCSKLREKYMFPIIMLTAKIDAMEKINGLTLGADDYLTKPFFPLELVARVKTQLRRSTVYNQNNQGAFDVEEYDIKGFRICKSSRKGLWL